MLLNEERLDLTHYPKEFIKFMFTGIIEEVGEVKSLAGRKLTVKAKKVIQDSHPGDSLAVNGVCLTITDLDKDSFTAEIMPETMKLTNLGRLRAGDLVNLERPLSYGGRLGGHLVQGHIDGMGKIVSLSRKAGEVEIKISFPPELSPYIVRKGFIAVDGVSLTVAELNGLNFTIFLVNYTLNNTNFKKKRVGDLVNLEVDFMAKYIEKMIIGFRG